MRKTIFCVALTALLFAFCTSAAAQQPAGKVPRIGFLHTGSASDPVNSRRLDVFRQSLRDLGYIEGKNITIEYRYGEGKSERLQQLTEELVRFNVDILVASTATAARSMRKATTTIPIVVANMGSLTGLVDSLARPGRNVTGLTHISSELLGKRLELLKEVLPKVSHFVFLDDTTGAGGYERVAKETQSAAKALGVKLQVVEVKAFNPNIEGVFQTMVKERVGGFIIEATPRMSFHRKKILTLAQQNRLPAMYSEEEWVNAGGLMS